MTSICLTVPFLLSYFLARYLKTVSLDWKHSPTFLLSSYRSFWQPRVSSKLLTGSWRFYAASYVCIRADPKQSSPLWGTWGWRWHKLLYTNMECQELRLSQEQSFLFLKKQYELYFRLNCELNTSSNKIFMGNTWPEIEFFFFPSVSTETRRVSPKNFLEHKLSPFIWSYQPSCKMFQESIESLTSKKIR